MSGLERNPAAWRTGEYMLVTSPVIVAEIKAVLELPRIRKKYLLTFHDIEQLLDFLEKDAILNLNLFISGFSLAPAVIKPVDSVSPQVLECSA